MVNLCTAAVYVGNHCTTLPYNRVQVPSNFTRVHMEWMTRGIFFIYTTNCCQCAPRAGRQAGVLSGCEKVQHGLTVVECNSRLLVFFSFLLPWTQASFKMSSLVSFRIVLGTSYHIRASTLTGVDTPTCPRKVKKRHTNTYWNYQYCYLFPFSPYFVLWFLATAWKSLALYRRFFTIQMCFLRCTLIVMLKHCW